VTSTEERADLGRIEPWARALGLSIWAFCGLTRLPQHYEPWVWPWLLYGAALFLPVAREQPGRDVHVGWLALQTACVLAMPRLGLPGFEGLLLSIVVVQLPLTLPLKTSVIWAVLHVPLLMPFIWDQNDRLSLFHIAGAYSTFSSFALLMHWLRMQEQRARNELAQSNASLLATRAMIVEGSRQAERLRISRELHDSLGHHLTALKLHLDLAARQADPKESVARGRDIASEALTEVRKVVSEMNESFDVTAGLKALAAGIPSPHITITAPDELSFDQETGHAVFRCVQEAITNAVKHAGAKNVWVDLGPERVTVRDDGVGTSAVHSGNGLNGIRSRIEQLGGTARFESVPGQGFAVRLEVKADP
jgi:signal transduction histidine kinase